MIEKLNDTFKDYIFIENGHTYLHEPTDTQLESVTSLLKRYCPKFDHKYWLAYKTFQKNGYTVKYIDDTCFEVDGSKFSPIFDSTEDFDFEFTEKDLKYEWELAAKIGNTRGTILHNYMENLWNRKRFQEQMPSIINSLSAVEAIKYIKSIEILKELGMELYKELYKTHVYIASEYVVGDVNLGIAGTFDLLLYNKLSGRYEIWDYKTDKKFKTERELISGFYIPFSTLAKYSLQLGIYKYLINKNCDIDIDKCYIVHFDFKKNKKTIIETNDYSEQIKTFFENGNNRTTYFQYKTIDKGE